MKRPFFYHIERGDRPLELFKLFGTIALDNTNANKGIDDTTDKAEKAQPKISKAFEKIGTAAVKAGKVIASGLAVGATAMGKLTMDALGLGGELEQNIGGSESVFGDYATKMQKTAKTAFDSMGLSASDFLATANKMGALFQGAGFGIEESANLSAEAMQRAADVASIMGIDTSAAMEAIAGAAKGNFTMMDNLGVAMNDTAIQNYALSKGIEKSTAEMTQQEKIGLAMEMFLEKTAYAAGNYSKENGTLAGSLGTAKAALSNFLSGAGDVHQLVDAFVNAGNVIIANLQTLLPRLVVGLNTLISELLPYIPGLVESLLPGVIDGAISLMTGLVIMLPDILRILLEQIPGIIVQIGGALVAAFPVLLETVKNLFGQIWGYISLELLNTGVSFEDAFVKMQVIFEGAMMVLKTLWDTIGQPVFGLIRSAVGIVRDAFSERMPEIKEFVGKCFEDVKKFWNNNLKPCFEAIGNFIQNVLAPIFKTVFEGTIGPVIDTVFNGIKRLWDNTLKPLFTGITDFLTGVFTGNWKQAWNGIVNIFKGIINIIPTALEAVINGAISLVNGLISGINKISSKLGLGEIKLISKVSLPKLEKGGILEKGQVGLLEGNGAEAVVPLDQNQAWINAVAQDMQGAMGGAGAIKLLEQILEALLALDEGLVDKLMDAFAAMKFDVNNREFARMVKAVN